MQFVAREHLRANGRTYQPGEVVPGAGGWPGLSAEIEALRIMPRQDNGKPCRWRATTGVEGVVESGQVLSDAESLPDFAVLVGSGTLVPVLEDDPPAPPAQQPLLPTAPADAPRKRRQGG